MSKHLVVPRWFRDTDQVTPSLAKKMWRVGAHECLEMVRAGRLESIGKSGKIWRLKMGDLRPDKIVKGGRVSRLIYDDLRECVAAEMGRRPMREKEYA